jgi:hypothetical protein
MKRNLFWLLSFIVFVILLGLSYNEINTIEDKELYNNEGRGIDCINCKFKFKGNLLFQKHYYRCLEFKSKTCENTKIQILDNLENPIEGVVINELYVTNSYGEAELDSNIVECKLNITKDNIINTVIKIDPNQTLLKIHLEK